MKNYLQKVKERAGIILLTGNILVMTFNLLYVSYRFDNLPNKQVFICELTSFTQFVCLEQ